MEQNNLKLSKSEVLEALINKYPNKTVEIITYELQRTKERVGLLGEHGLLKVQINFLGDNEEKNKEVILFTKFFPLGEPARFAKETGAFTKEIFIYNLFNKMIDTDVNCITKCTSRSCFTKEDFVIILDNLLLENFNTIDKHVCLDFDTISVVLSSLSNLHAASLIYEEKLTKERNSKYRLIDDYEKNFVDTFYNNREDFINKLGVYASIKCILKEIEIFGLDNKLRSGKDFKSTANKVCHKIFDIVKPSTKFRNVVCHGDLWNTNFLIKYDKESRPLQCKFVDFQCSRYLPPAHDVMALLYLTTTREFRKDNIYKLIGIYYANLEKCLKVNGFNLQDLIPFEEFLESCRQQKVFALIQAATYFQLILVDPKVIEEFSKDKDLYEKTFFDDRSLLLLAYIDKDERYRKRLKESIEDLREYCENFY